MPSKEREGEKKKKSRTELVVACKSNNFHQQKPGWSEVKGKGIDGRKRSSLGGAARRVLETRIVRGGSLEGGVWQGLRRELKERRRLGWTNEGKKVERERKGRDSDER